MFFDGFSQPPLSLYNNTNLHTIRTRLSVSLFYVYLDIYKSYLNVPGKQYPEILYRKRKIVRGVQAQSANEGKNLQESMFLKLLFLKTVKRNETSNVCPSQ